MLINLVKKNIIKFIKIISFLFEQINTGDTKINNIWILLKRSLTVCLFPIFLISFLFNQFTIINKYIMCIVIIYIFFIVLNYLKNNFFILIIDRFLLIFLALLIFLNNKIISEKDIFIVVLSSICIILAYITIFFFYKKIRKQFILNFSKLSNFLELILAIFVLCFGINSFITFNILCILMVDIFYKILILSIILNLKKRFSIQ